MELSSECVKDVLLEIESIEEGNNKCFPVDVNPDLIHKYDPYVIMKHLQLCRMNGYVNISIESNEGIFVEGLSADGQAYLDEVRNS